MIQLVPYDSASALSANDVAGILAPIDAAASLALQITSVLYSHL